MELTLIIGIIVGLVGGWYLRGYMPKNFGLFRAQSLLQSRQIMQPMQQPPATQQSIAQKSLPAEDIKSIVREVMRELQETEENKKWI